MESKASNENGKKVSHLSFKDDGTVHKRVSTPSYLLKKNKVSDFERYESIDTTKIVEVEKVKKQDKRLDDGPETKKSKPHEIDLVKKKSNKSPDKETEITTKKKKLPENGTKKKLTDSDDETGKGDVSERIVERSGEDKKSKKVVESEEVTKTDKVLEDKNFKEPTEFKEAETAKALDRGMESKNPKGPGGKKVDPPKNLDDLDKVFEKKIDNLPESHKDPVETLDKSAEPKMNSKSEEVKIDSPKTSDKAHDKESSDMTEKIDISEKVPVPEPPKLEPIMEMRPLLDMLEKLRPGIPESSEAIQNPFSGLDTLTKMVSEQSEIISKIFNRLQVLEDSLERKVMKCSLGGKDCGTVTKLTPKILEFRLTVHGEGNVKLFPKSFYKLEPQEVDVEIGTSVVVCEILYESDTYFLVVPKLKKYPSRLDFLI